MRIPGEKKKRKVRKNTWRHTAENFPNLVKYMRLKSKKFNKQVGKFKQTYSIHIVIELSKGKGKDRILKASRE